MELKQTYKGKKIYKSTGSRPWVVQHHWASGHTNDLDHFRTLRQAKSFIDRMEAERA